jgi:hypothetical protein
LHSSVGPLPEFIDLAEVIERCIEKAKVLNETESRTAAIEAIFAEYDVRHVDPEKEREAAVNCTRWE